MNEESPQEKPRAFAHLQRTWEILGADDPLWAILSWRGKRGVWDADEFFATGREEIAKLVEQLSHLGFTAAHGPVLDFGCGIGRLTLALAAHFDQVHGADISSSMIKRACAVNSSPPRVTYHLNQRNDLALFPDGMFRLVHSNLVLQHMPPSCSRVYIREFCRILAPGGMAAFQIPSHRALTAKTVAERVLPRAVADLWKRSKNRQSASMDMYGICETEIRQILQEGSLTVVAVNAPTQAMNGWYNRWYFARKQA